MKTKFKLSLPKELLKYENGNYIYESPLNVDEFVYHMIEGKELQGNYLKELVLEHLLPCIDIYVPENEKI